VSDDLRAGQNANQPVTMVIDAVRTLTQGSAAVALLGHGDGYYVPRALAWAVGISVVFAALAIDRFNGVRRM
jgi:ABC-2 type transport system permease protein/oleandomycin transport system permease protein